MPKDTQKRRKSVPPAGHLFDSQQLAFAQAQSFVSHTWAPARNSLCPVLVRCRVEAKQADREAARQLNLVKQRERRKAAKLLHEAANYFPAHAVLVVTPEGLRLDEAPAAQAPPVAPVVVPPAAPAPRIRRPVAELAEATASLEEVWKRSRRAKKARKSADELIVHTIDVTPPHLQAREQAKKMRLKCLDTAELLKERGAHFPALMSAGNKVQNCSVWGLYQSISADVNYKVGTALCKCRACPNCQRVLAAKKRKGGLEWFELNRQALRPYFFYHMVLTVRHSAKDGVRNRLYTPDLLGYFAQLRGTHKDMTGHMRRLRAGRWKEYVAGGSYSVEVKQGRDSSPHIHIHCLLVGNRRLSSRSGDSEFLSYVKDCWKGITGDSDNVFVEPVYYLNDAGKKVPAFKGSDLDVSRAVAECMKYTIKADAASLADYSSEFLNDLLTFRNRYYARFGCMSSNDKTSAQFQKMELLRTDYQDLEQITKQELARLCNPETGELIEAEDTQFVATPHRNMRPNPVHEVAQSVEVSVKMVPSGKVYPLDGSPLAGRPILVPQVHQLEAPVDERVKPPEIYYSAVELPAYLARAQYRHFPYQEKQRAAIWLSRSIAGDYDEKLELAYQPPAQKST